MFYHAHNGSVRVGNSEMDYVSFGNGNKNLIMLPGLGDGLSTVKGMAFVFSMMYRIYANEFTVYVFSRKNDLQEVFYKGNGKRPGGSNERSWYFQSGRFRNIPGRHDSAISGDRLSEFGQ